MLFSGKNLNTLYAFLIVTAGKTFHGKGLNITELSEQNVKRLFQTV